MANISPRNLLNEDAKVNRDRNTPDVFHLYTEEELTNISNKVLSYTSIQKRFGTYVTPEFVKNFVLRELEKNPDFKKITDKWKNYKCKNNRASATVD